MSVFTGYKMSKATHFIEVYKTIFSKTDKTGQSVQPIDINYIEIFINGSLRTKTVAVFHIKLKNNEQGETTPN